MKLLLFALWASSIAAYALACTVGDDHPDRVHELPGWNQPLPTAMYSGMLDYELDGRTVHTHYVLMEAEDIGREDSDAPDDRPLIYWSNGGPGASSLFGLMTELGPLWIDDRSLQTEEYRNTGIPTPMYNPYGWTRLGSILIFDQPAPVGFSYCNDDPKSHSCGGILWNDTIAAENSYAAFRAFHERHPCYRDNNVDMYLTGESYAGIYIPMLAAQIIDHQDTYPVPLKGIAVGDGCLGTETGVCGGTLASSMWHLLFFAGHGQIPWSTYEEAVRICGGPTPNSNPPDQTKMGRLHRPSTATTTGSISPECDAVLKKASQQGGGYYEYSLYDDCTYRNGLLFQDDVHRPGSPESIPVRQTSDGYPCGGGIVMEDYMRIPAVKKALHVEDSVFFSVDNAAGDFDYTPSAKDLSDLHKKFQSLPDFKVLIYNGDTDPAITSFQAQDWTSRLGFNIQQDWTPWTVDGCRRMGGFVVQYEDGFHFLTIRGAGHMVPTYKPAASFVFLDAWLKGGDYPTYDPECTDPLQSGPLFSSS